MFYALRNSVLFSITFLVGTFLLAAPPGAHAQEISYVQHDYMKVPPGQAEAYVELEQNLWKPIHRQRSNDGTIAGWNLYEVVYPAGANREYDYVTVAFFEEWDGLENSITMDHIEQAHPNKDPQEILQQTIEARSVVHSEVVEVIDSVTAENEQSDTEEDQVSDTEESQESEDETYLRVDFMKVPEGGGSAYVQMEQHLWKPIHQELVEQTGQQAWYLVERQFAGANDPYQYMTIQPIASWSDVEPATYSEAIGSAIQKVHSDTSVNEIGERTQETRTIVRSEIWRLVDSVEPSN